MNLKPYITMEAKGAGAVSFISEDWLTVPKARMLAREIGRFPYIKDIHFEDEKGASWTLKELEKLTEELSHEPDDITVYFDGSYDKQSRQAGLGIAVYYSLGAKRHRLRRNKSLLLNTNNEAEYAALYEALREVKEIGASRNSITIRGDSLVVLHQLDGSWPCYDESQNEWLDKIEALLDSLKLTPTYEAIDRKENQEADDLAKKILLDQRIESRMILEGNGDD
ncbi:reverse transcriptase-like protein [Bacillus sp. ISL-51]|uniref:ribonuclease H family protein n=1 Tax=Bacteria TaxID=2 RepID=UPI001BED2AEB|nr:MULTISPECIES: ribonuclease H family protein [Bacteria]MBT2575391.1 reverse transcriptase-like protein [Bacillus sp. ISL-51]MBT2713028.1 reverse transcriptase-like protein [Pseudomonas sp. ISL-88]